MEDFYLFANCNFVPDRYNDWQAAYNDLATYVSASEPSTKTYYFGIPIDYEHDFSKTTSMLAFEVYGRREDLYETHLNSRAMQAFLRKVPEASTTDLDLNHYQLVSGFLDSSEDQASAKIMQDIQIKCSCPGVREAFLESLSQVVNLVPPGNGGTLTYMAFKGLDDDTSVRVYGRWETREDLEKFIRREEVVGFWMQNKGYIRAMEQRLYVPNGKGWLHRGKYGSRSTKAESTML